MNGPGPPCMIGPGALSLVQACWIYSPGVYYDCPGALTSYSRSIFYIVLACRE